MKRWALAVAALLVVARPSLSTGALRPWAGMRDASLILPSASIDPTFHFQPGNTGPNDLSDSLTINGTATTLANSCIGRSAGLTCTTAVADAGAGTAATTTILTASHAFDSTERGVVFGSGQKRLDPATSSTWDLGTQDFFVEGVIQSPASGAVILDKSLASTDGWSLTMNGTTAVRLSLRTGSVTTTVAGPSNNPTGARFHFICFVDRSEASTNGSACYADGVQGTGVNMSARVASASNAVVASVGAVSGGTSTVSTILELKTWVCSACAVGGAPNLTEWALIARDRAAIANGVSPIIAAGSRIPTTMTRASIANVDVVDGTTRMLYTLGNAGMRVAKRTAAGTAFAGFLSEPATTNIALQSQTLGTTWTAIDVGDNALADAFAGADLSVTGDDVDGDNTGASEHGLRQAITHTATTHTESVWARAGEQNFVALRNATIADGTAWFGLAACAACTIGEDCAAAVGTVQAGVSQARASRWPIDTTGDGVADVNLCRVSITYAGTAAPHNVDMLCAPSDAVTSYTDTGAAADCGFWGAMVEAFPTATSYIATTITPATRAGDILEFSGASHFAGSPTTLDTVVLCPNYTTGAAGPYFNAIGVSSGDFMGHGIEVSSGKPRFIKVPSTGWDVSPALDPTDGVVHRFRTTAATSNIEFFYDGVSRGTNVSASLPTTAGALISINGVIGFSSTNPACVIQNSRVYSGLYTPAQVP